MRFIALSITFLAALGPVFYLALPSIHEAWLALLRPLLSSPDLPLGLTPDSDLADAFLRISSNLDQALPMLLYAAATWAFVRFTRHSPMSKWYWPIWNPLLLSGMALVNFGNMPAGFLAIAGFALLSKTYDRRRDVAIAEERLAAGKALRSS